MTLNVPPWNKLALRTAQKGPNAGNKFWGCEGFPKCRAVQEAWNMVGLNPVPHLASMAVRWDCPGLLQARKPTDNLFIESFNSSFRDECLNTNWFPPLNNAKEKLVTWRIDYNQYRPHSSLNDLTPEEFYLRYHVQKRKIFRKTHQGIN